MDICIQTCFVPETRSPVRTLRLKTDENERYWNLMDRAKARNPYARESDVFRELIGLHPPHYLKAAEIDYFREGREGSNVEIVPDSQIAFVPSIGELGELTNETKTPIKRKAGRK